VKEKGRKSPKVDNFVKLAYYAKTVLRERKRGKVEKG
jgi:hypothetical protein